jgi:hypothetical protein
VTGEIDLFASNDQYYIASEKRGRFQLAQGKAVDQGQALKNYQTNTGIFNILFQDCPSVREAAQKVTLSEENLISLISSYHTCRGVPHKEFPSKKGKRDNHLGFFAGQSISTLFFGEPNTFAKGQSYLYYSNFAASTQPTFGLTALWGGRGPSSILSIQSELIYTKANYSASYMVDESIPNYDIKQTYATTVDYSRLSLLAGLRITGRSNTMNPYFSFGLATQRFLSMNLHVHQTIEVNSSIEIRDYELPVSDGSFAVWTAAGVKKKILRDKFLFLDVNYESSYISYSARITALSLRAGFMF